MLAHSSLVLLRRCIGLTHRELAEIEASREKSWIGVDSRTHTVHGLYRSTQKAQQFVLLGSLEIRLANEKGTLTRRFCSKLDMRQTSDAVEIVRYEAFAVCSQRPL